MTGRNYNILEKGLFCLARDKLRIRDKWSVNLNKSGVLSEFVGVSEMPLICPHSGHLNRLVSAAKHIRTFEGSSFFLHSEGFEGQNGNWMSESPFFIQVYHVPRGLGYCHSQFRAI